MPFKQRPPFFLVWNSATGYTKHRHGTVEAAEAEAQRLANLHPRTKFHVLVALGRCTDKSDNAKGVEHEVEPGKDNKKRLESEPKPI